MNGGNTTDVEVLRALLEDPRLDELEEHVSSLSLFRALEVDRHEVAHSRVLAALLDPRRHQGAETILRTLLGEVLKAGLDSALAGRLAEIMSGPWERVSVRREHLFIDVVVEISSSRGAAVVGIENKIDAGEQDRQISRYQDALGRAYPGRAAIVVFLTPTGREPTTADPHSPVPVVALGYEAVLAAVEEARSEATPGSREENVLGEVAAHLKEDIVGDPESRALVREVWRTHRRALWLAVRRRPQLEDIRDLYVKLLEQRFGTDIEISYYPEKRGALREIKMDLPAWHDRGFPFTFMLHAKEWGRPRVRVLIWYEGYAEHAESLRNWALRVNARAGPIIDEGFTPISDWKVWHRVFREDDHPESAVVDEMVFDEGTAKAAVEGVSTHIEMLRRTWA